MEIINLGENYDKISNLANLIYNSIYNIPPSLYTLYIRDPKRILSIMHNSLKDIGINISVSWLSRKIRKRNGDSRVIKINYGKMYGRKIYNSKEFRKNFMGKNKQFIENLKLLNKILENEFKLVYNELINGKNDKLTYTKFKFLFNKLGTFINDKLIDDDVFNYVYDKPWLVDLKRFRGYVNLKNKVFSNINTQYSDYNNIFIWLIGEYNATEYLERLEHIYIYTLNMYNKELRLTNTMACESILKLLRNKNVKLNRVQEVKELLKEKLKTRQDYIFIRNAFMLLSVVDSSYLINIKDDLTIELKCVLEWIRNNLGVNIIDIVTPMYNGYGIYLPNEETIMSGNSPY